MLPTRLQPMSSVHLHIYSTVRCFGVRTGLIFWRTLSSLDVDLIDRTHEGSGAFETRSTTEKLPMSALGQKRTWKCVRAMSALPPKADIAERDWHVRFVPKGDIAHSVGRYRC